MQTVKAVALVLALAVSSRYMAVAEQRATGDTSGPAIGTPVTPPTVVQKQNPHIPPEKKSGASGTSAGAPGIEGGVDTQSGQSSGGRRY